MNKNISKEFDNTKYYWKAGINYRENPEKYKIGKGEQGVLLCEPYKSEILPFWRFKTPEIALESSSKIFELFLNYLANDDFIGADMARKFLQMGFTRARRFANYKAGQKYDKQTQEQLTRGTGQVIKAKSAEIFYHKWREAEANILYKDLKQKWKKKYG